MGEKAWTYEGHRQNTANGGMTFDHKITHGDKVIQTGEFVFDVKENSPAKFEMEHVNKMTMTEESPFYARSHCGWSEEQRVCLRQHPGQEALQVLLQPRRLQPGLPVRGGVGVPRHVRSQVHPGVQEGRCLPVPL